MRLMPNRSVSGWIELAAGILALAAAIVYAVYSLQVQLFRGYICAVMALAVLPSVGTLLTGRGIFSLGTAALSALSFGLYLEERVPMFAYMATGVYGMTETGAILPLVVLILALSLLSAVLACGSSFFPAVCKKDASKSSQKIY